MNLRDTVAEIKSRTDCRDLAEELGLPRKWNSFLCPFHEDRDPSLSIKAGGFKCYGCGAEGDAIELYRRVKGVTFRDALEHLARRAGVPLSRFGRGRAPRARTATVVRQEPVAPIPANRADDPPAIDPDRRIALLTAFVEASRLRADYAPHAPALNYLKRRGISAATAIDAGLGFVSDYALAGGWLREQASLTELQATSLFNEKGNLRLYAHRLLMPYWINGEVVSLQARNISWRDKERDGAKELTVGPVTIPFNSDVLLEPQATVYVCEGAMDTLSLLELSFAAVGIPGARNCRREWVELFADVTEVVLALDNDRAGDEGAAVIAGHFERSGKEAKRLQLPEGVKDINQFLAAAL
jgi:DNA primase